MEDRLDSLSKTIHKKIRDAADKRGAHLEASIYRVPHELRNLKISAYRPRLVSIGPFHSKNKKLFGQELKASYADSLLSRVRQQKNKLLKECVKEMEDAVDEAKKCYSEQVDKLNAEMLLLDGCFVLEFLYKDYQINQLLVKKTKASIDEANQIRRGDKIFCSALTHKTVQHDLLLLENQLPFFVLEKLFYLTVERVPNRPCTLSKYVISSFGDLIGPKPNTENETSCGECVLCLKSFCTPRQSMSTPITVSESMLTMMQTSDLAPSPSMPPSILTPSPSMPPSILMPSPSMPSTLMPSKMYIVEDKRENMELKKDIGKENYHILHILHCHHRQAGGKSRKKERVHKYMHSASDLNFAGVKFVPKDCFNISFNKSRGRFEIPNLRIDNFTEPFLRNLIAFEQCCPRVDSYFTSFAFLMDSLISTTKDVEVLKNDGVIHSYLGTDEDVSDLFNKLCKEVVLTDFKFAETCKQADKYSKRCWPVTVAYVRRQYFASLWTTIAFLVAFIFFGITVTNLARSFL